ncbi:hypothetical protein BGX20_006215 [Mortierella sp. AD010]|nr:hypothetical protein BGX20_006215 [Mortierella sp. AD010]
MATELTLWCLVEGESKPFSVDIKSNQTVEKLQKAIIPETRSLKGLYATELSLWKANILIADTNEPEYHRDYEQCVNNFKSDNTNKLGNPSSFISTKFQEGSVSGAIQVIVQKPPSGKNKKPFSFI